MNPRRNFLRRSLSGLLAAWLAGCAPGLSGPNQTLSEEPDLGPTATAGRTQRPTSTALPTATTRPTTDQRSRLARVRHKMLWKDGEIDPDALRQMLDSSITSLTGMAEPVEAWKHLFKPYERVAIKVNSILSGSTHLALAIAVAHRLEDAGVAPEQIVLFDRSTDELKKAGFPTNSSGKGLGCYGSDLDFVDGGKVEGTQVRVSKVLAECDALINLPVLKAYSLGGMSFALKNHYGSIDNPSRFHGGSFAGGVTGINLLDPIRSKERLVIADVLSRETREDIYNYVLLGEENCLIAGFDPAAVDALGFSMVKQWLAIQNRSPGSITTQVNEWLALANQRGLGAIEDEKIDLVEYAY